ncbi:MAG: hypothetical protein DMF61_14855 [Blastocatellia bacterium AA13]|nr:MAG: hypothetical protein DMF61_14855 [Blastocatellia bacterium AA13]
MEPGLIIAGAAGIAALGIGLGSAVRLIPMYAGARGELKRFEAGNEAVILDDIEMLEMERRHLGSPPGRKRDASIVGLYDSALRHSDGSYTMGYRVELAPTVYGEDHVIEARADAIARLLAVRKPPGTVLQFRLSVGVDPGRAILRHVATRDEGRTHAEAALFHNLGVEYYQEAALRGAFKQTVLTLWVRVPVKHKSDAHSNGLNTFVPAMRREIKRHGWMKLTGAIAAGYEASSDDGIVRRIEGDEREARAEAERVFRLVERESPLEMKRLTRDELWAAVYLGHSQDARGTPILPDEPGLDLRDYLCGETISSQGPFMLHGSHPAAVVSMFVPPQPAVQADVLRSLVLDSELSFRHTIVAEFVYPDQRKAVKLLDKRIRQVRRTRLRADGRVRETPEAHAAMADLQSVRSELTGEREAVVKARIYAVIYAPPARDEVELVESASLLNGYCEELVSAMRRMPGADASREEPAALRAVYHRALVGECDSRPTGREITETAHSLAPLVPSESIWEGSLRPHTLFSTPSGRLIGFDLYDRALIPSPLVLIVAAPGGGKSVLMARTITDVLGSRREARVRAVDFGESMGPLVDVLKGRHLRFNLSDTRTINVWDYEGLDNGDPPDEVQIGFVVGDLMQLAQARETDSLAEDILNTLVTEVYKNEAPRNGKDLPKHEPTHVHLLELLKSYPFKHRAAQERAESLSLALERFRDHPWLDAPTHLDFAVDSPFDVYELDSLEMFPPRVQESLAFRVAAKVTRSIGRLNEDGTRSPTLLAFDEVHKIVDRYPAILKVIKKGARMGRKENVVTMLASQGYQDFEGVHDLTKTAGVKIVGKQIGEYDSLVTDAGLAPVAVGAINGIRNLPGSHAQFLLAIGAGDDKIVEMIQVDLSPMELWTFTSNPDERNARARVTRLKSGWTLAECIAWLAMQYPRGLTAERLVEIDESLLLENQTRERVRHSPLTIDS